MAMNNFMPSGNHQNYKPPRLGFLRKALAQISQARDVFRNGQNLLEFALIFPVLLLLIVGAIDIGRVFLTGVVVANAAREGTRFATSFGILYDQTKNKLLPVENGNLIKNAVIAETSAAGLNLTTLEISCLSCSGGSCSIVGEWDCSSGTCTPVLMNNTCLGGHPVRLNVSTNFPPILTFIFGATMPITRTAEMMIPSGGN